MDFGALGDKAFGVEGMTLQWADIWYHVRQGISGNIAKWNDELPGLIFPLTK